MYSFNFNGYAIHFLLKYVLLDLENQSVITYSTKIATLSVGVLVF